MFIVSTASICEMLGVSRSWVNAHIRHLGIDPKKVQGKDFKNLATVWYDVDKVMKWFNENAEFTAQTKFIDWTDYVPEATLNAEFDRIKTLYNPETNPESYIDALDDLRKRTLPNHVYECLYPDNRARGYYDWVSVPAEIKTFEKLQSVNDILRSIDKKTAEMAYRHIFNNGYVKVSVAGRVWFLDPDVRSKMIEPIRVSADCKD